MPAFADLAAVAAELYAGPPATFVARRRDAVSAAKEAGDRDLAREIATLRRPTAAAAAVNVLPDSDLDAVSALAVRMREATQALRTGELKELSAQRTQLIARIVSGVEGSAAVREEVRATLLAAVADPRAEAAVRSRTLVRSLSYAGFGEVEVDGATAMPVESSGANCEKHSHSANRLSLVPSPERIDEARAAVELAERRLAGAQDAFAAAEAALASAGRGLDAARARLRSVEEPTSVSAKGAVDAR